MLLTVLFKCLLFRLISCRNCIRIKIKKVWAILKEHQQQQQQKQDVVSNANILLVYDWYWPLVFIIIYLTFLLFSSYRRWNDNNVDWMGVFLWAEIVPIVSIGKFVTMTRNHSSLYEKRIQTKANVYTYYFKRTKWVRKNKWILYASLAMDAQRDIWSISASPSAMILLFMLVQSVTHSIVVYLTLLVCFCACACAHTVHTVPCQCSFITVCFQKYSECCSLWDVSLSCYQFWSKEFIELTHLVHIRKCGVRRGWEVCVWSV